MSCIKDCICEFNKDLKNKEVVKGKDSGCQVQTEICTVSKMHTTVAFGFISSHIKKKTCVLKVNPVQSCTITNSTKTFKKDQI